MCVCVCVCVCAENEEAASRELLSWEFWDGQPTLIVNAGELSESLVRRGIHLGQKLCATFSTKAAEDQGHWVDGANARTGLPQDTLSFELPLEAAVAKRIWFLCLRSR